VATLFVKHIKQFLLPYMRTKSARNPIISLYEEEEDESKSGQRERREAARLTVARADHLLDDIQERIRELKSLEDNARKTATAVSASPAHKYNLAHRDDDTDMT
jgi:hypothetical protein